MVIQIPIGIGNRQMAECLVIPLVTAQPTAQAAEAALEAEGSGVGFTLEGIVPEDVDDAPESTDATVETASPDLLRMLIEDLSGISGALRPAAQGKSDAAAPPDHARRAETGSPPADTAPRIAPPITLDAAEVDAAPADGAVLAVAFGESVAQDMAFAEVESLLADAPAPGVSSPRTETLPLAEARAPRAPLPVPPARQIAEAVVTARDDVVEIALAPEELGRIRMVMSGPEHMPHVMIWVERPDTLDQLRRNAAFLQECFGDAGMADASFEFAGDTPSGSRDDAPATKTPDRTGFDMVEDIRAIPVAWTPMVVSARLDIRI